MVVRGYRRGLEVMLLFWHGETAGQSFYRLMKTPIRRMGGTVVSVWKGSYMESKKHY